MDSEHYPQAPTYKERYGVNNRKCGGGKFCFRTRKDLSEKFFFRSFGKAVKNIASPILRTESLNMPVLVAPGYY